MMYEATLVSIRSGVGMMSVELFGAPGTAALRLQPFVKPFEILGGERPEQVVEGHGLPRLLALPPRDLRQARRVPEFIVRSRRGGSVGGRGLLLLHRDVHDLADQVAQLGQVQGFGVEALADAAG